MMDAQIETHAQTSTAGDVLAAGSVATPFGELYLATSADGVRYVRLPGAAARHFKQWLADHAATVISDSPLLRQARTELAEYFAGSRREFSLPLDLRGTEFQCRVWHALVRVAYGTTTSYGAIARAIGEPGKSRPVGAANGANPAAIIVPCHRIIGADGSLTGYGGGLPMKLWLLKHEGALIA
ncbi:MAG: methylated-DNA--[protein]-cysteine S-methyltransferase [Deltaproteobacteria bacterium]|nr:methylated-DNA--[protein]-cysteine S-methyltransferase [Deltaproteobacteria bacterium]MBI3386649.1 methylated-DNA--[protein]-cysteine S-methyltransferase [Deltaproteobacteria bacterium]